MGIATNIGQSDREARYELPDNEMSVGSTLGGPRGTCIVKASGAIDRIYSTDCGLNLFGTILLRHFDGRTGMLLAQQKPGKFVILPENQEHLYMLSNDVEVRENIFVLGGSPESMQISTPPAVYLSIELRNTTNETLVIETFGFAQLRGKTDPDLRAEWNSALNCMIATNISAPSQCRIFATSTSPESFETNFDKGMPVLQTSPGKLKNAMSENGDQIGVTRHIHTVNPGEMVSWNYLMTFGAGREDALKNLALAPDYSAGLLQTKQYFQKVLKNAIVMTPNEMINLGVLWAKANMVRVQNQAPTGWCFVNDPTQSRNSVGRDTAWFAFGSDFVRPEFSRESLMAYVNNQEEDGLIVEYYDVRNGKTEDYKLNINDNTPLLVLALWHHFNATGDKSFLESVYPAVRKAIGKILKERDHRGLVWCTATGTSDWGIIGWRNVITDYRISGATTEVNSECYAALLSAQRMAKLLGADDESKSYGESAVELRNSINKHLINPENGLYYLNIGVDETRHKEVTSDLVFPVMYGVADHDISARIVSRLSVRDFWTAAGIRTSPRDAIDYNPAGGTNGPYGLMGGVWLGVSFWFAFAAARFNQEFMVHALSASFRNFAIDPRRNNTVPGQFAEWLHGETIVNQGMMLSPWDAPRYLWAAVEGVGGLNLDGDTLACTPRLAPEWKWLGVRNVSYRGKSVSWLAVRANGLQIYANFELSDNIDHHAYDEDISDHVLATADNLCVMGFRQNEELLIFAGSTAPDAILTSVRLLTPLQGSYKVSRFNSLLGYWVDDKNVTGASLEMGYVLQIEREGCVLLRLTSTDREKAHHA